MSGQSSSAPFLKFTSKAKTGSNIFGVPEFDAFSVFQTGQGEFQAKDYLGDFPLSVTCKYHNDSMFSADLKFETSFDHWVFNCSKCGYSAISSQTGTDVQLDELGFCYYGSGIYQYGVSPTGFFFTKISQDNFMHSLGIEEKSELREKIKYLIQNRRFRSNPEIEASLDMNLVDKSVSCDFLTGKVEIKYASKEATVEDNKLVEDYLVKIFGSNTEFIKKWLALYCYTNFLRLPTLFFFGPRASGKSTFIEMLRRFCPDLYADWSGKTATFNYEYEKRLIVVEENLSGDKKLYRTLKKISGQDYNHVNKKLQAPILVRNNMTPIIISNEFDSLYLEKNEQPSSELDNQWFVWKFYKVDQPDSTFIHRLAEAFPHYAKTVLNDIYQKFLTEGPVGRYQIAVPITEQLDKLFNTNVPVKETDTDIFIDVLENQNWFELKTGDKNLIGYREFYKRGLLPTALVGFILNAYHIHSTSSLIMKELKLRGHISYAPEKICINGNRYRCSKILSKAGDGPNSGNSDIIGLL